LSVGSPLRIYTRLGAREVPVRWAWFRPEPQVGDTVRIPTGPGDDEGWRSFLVVGKRLRPDARPVGAPAIDTGAINLDIEPLAPQD
jgi:hypothetical protein